MPRGETRVQRLTDAATSSAVMALPLWKTASVRSGMVTTVPFSVIAGSAEASTGITSHFELKV